MALAGFLEQFNFTPHLAARFECDCEKVSITPIVVTKKDKGPEIVESPAPSGAISGADPKVYEVEIAIDWAVTIKYTAGTFGCEANYLPTAASANWTIDGKKSAPVGLDSHEGAGPGGKVVCAGECGQEISLHPPKRTTYKVSVKKGAGGVITNKVSDVITLAMNPVDCEGTGWTMVLVYEADVKKGVVRIDPNLSNWDGDKKINAADKNPLDPTRP